ncbi:MAG: hypothetical protein JWM17_3314 [Actinobacteria bacterium]|nr:hypothetical protein [Actinomycetota bacterium]
MSDFVREENWGLSVMSQTARIAFNSCWGARSNGQMEARARSITTRPGRLVVFRAE